jgi:hypothetical protein
MITMTTDEALDLKVGDRVRVLMVGRSHRWQTAIVTDAPHAVGRWVLVGFAYARGPAGRETLNRPTHHAQVPLDGLSRGW